MKKNLYKVFPRNFSNEYNLMMLTDDEAKELDAYEADVSEEWDKYQDSLNFNWNDTYNGYEPFKDEAEELEAKIKEALGKGYDEISEEDEINDREIREAIERRKTIANYLENGFTGDECDDYITFCDALGIVPFGVVEGAFAGFLTRYYSDNATDYYINVSEQAYEYLDSGTDDFEETDTL